MSQSHQQESKPTFLISQSEEGNQPGQMEGLNQFQEGLLVDYSKNFSLDMNFIEEEEMNFDMEGKSEEGLEKAPSQEMGQTNKGFTQEIVQQHQTLSNLQKSSLIREENLNTQSQLSDIQRFNQVNNDFKQFQSVSEVFQRPINVEKKLTYNEGQENIIEEEKMVEENPVYEHPSTAIEHELEQLQPEENSPQLPEYLLPMENQYVETMESNMDIEPIQQEPQFHHFEPYPNQLDQSLTLLQPQSIKNPEQKFQIKLIGDYSNDKLEKLEYPLLQSVEGDLNLEKQERNQQKMAQHLSVVGAFSLKRQSFQYFNESDQSVTNCQFVKESFSGDPKNLLKEFKNEHYQVRDRYFEEESRIYKKYILNMQKTLRKQYEKCRLRGDYLSISFDEEIPNTKEEMERKITDLAEQRIKEQFESRKYSPNEDDNEILPDGSQKNQYSQNNEDRQNLEMKLGSGTKQVYETMKLFQGQKDQRGVQKQLLIEFEHLKNENIESNSTKFSNYLRHVMIHMSKFQDLSDRVQEVFKMSYQDLMEFYSSVVGTRNVINYLNYTQKESPNDSDSNQFNDYLDHEDMGSAGEMIRPSEENIVRSQGKNIETQEINTELIAYKSQANSEHPTVTNNNLNRECTNISAALNSITQQQMDNTQRNGHFYEQHRQLTITQTQLQMETGITSALQQLSNKRTQSHSDPMNQLLKPKPETAPQDYQIIEEIDEQQGTPVFGAGLLGEGMVEGMVERLEHNVLQVSQDKEPQPINEPTAPKPSSQPLISFNINNTLPTSFPHPPSPTTDPSSIILPLNTTPTQPSPSVNEKRIFSQQRIKFGSSLDMQKSIEKMSAQQLREFIKNSFMKKSEGENGETTKKMIQVQSHGNNVTRSDGNNFRRSDGNTVQSLPASEQIELENQPVIQHPSIPQQQVTQNNPVQQKNVNEPRQQQVIDILSEDSEQSIKIPFLQPLLKNTQTSNNINTNINANPNANVNPSTTLLNQQQSLQQQNLQTLSQQTKNPTTQTNQPQPFQHPTQHNQQPTPNPITHNSPSSSPPSKNKQPSAGISAHDIRAVLLETYPNLEAIIFAASDEEILALYFQLTGKQDAIPLENHREHKTSQQLHVNDNMRIDTIQSPLNNSLNQNNHISPSHSTNPFQSLQSPNSHPQTIQLNSQPQATEQLPPSYQQQLTYEQLDIVIKNLIEANQGNPELKEQISQLSREELLAMYREGMRQSRKEQKVKRKPKGPAQVIDLEEQPNITPTSVTNSNQSIPLPLTAAQSQPQSFSYIQIFNEMQQQKKHTKSTKSTNSANPKKILVNKNYLYSYIEAHDWDSKSSLQSILRPNKESLKYQQQTKKEVATIYLKTTQQNGPLHKIMNDGQRHEGKENSFILLGQKKRLNEISNQSLRKNINEDNHIVIEKPTMTEEKKNRILQLRNKRLLTTQSIHHQQPYQESPITHSLKATQQLPPQSLISIPSVSTPFLSTILSSGPKTCRRYWLMVEEQDMDPRQHQRLQEEIGLECTRKRVKRTVVEKDDKRVLKLIKHLAQHLENEIQLE